MKRLNVKAEFDNVVRLHNADKTPLRGFLSRRVEVNSTSGYLPDNLNIEPKFDNVVRLHYIGFTLGAYFACRPSSHLGSSLN